MNYLFDLLEKILGNESGSVELEIPEENFNLLALRILQEKAKKEGKNLLLKATGSRSKRWLAASYEPPLGPQTKLGWGQALHWVKIPLILAFSLGIIGVVAYLLLYFLPRVTITLALSPLPLVKEIPVTASTGSTAIDAKTGTIPGTVQTVTESGQKSTDATGTATVGDKAKGTITFTSAQTQSCSQGTKVQENSSGLFFFLDAALNFDSPGSKDASVTAERIGSNYNISSGKSFSVISGCSVGGISISGTNSAAFTGGTSQQVTVVAAADQTKLLGDLTSQLTEKAKTDLASQGGADETVVGEAIKSEVSEQTFSPAVGEQAKTETLTLKMKFTTITYKGADIQELVTQEVGGLVPDGFALFPGETKIETLEPQLSDKALSFQARITAQVVPKIDLEKIAADLSGRNLDSARQYLASIDNISSYKLEFWPNLPESLRRIPADKGRIKIVLETKQ